MSAQTHRGISALLIVSSATWIAAPSAAQQSATTPAGVSHRVEIDRAALAIDVAAQRRLLDASIQRALYPTPVATRAVDGPRLATSEARPRG
jgi:hypothetical protein